MHVHRWYIKHAVSSHHFHHNTSTIQQRGVKQMLPLCVFIKVLVNIISVSQPRLRHL